MRNLNRGKGGHKMWATYVCFKNFQNERTIWSPWERSKQHFMMLPLTTAEYKHFLKI
jgi:hypothetical protein